MRLDKFLSETATLSRSETKKAAKKGCLAVNGTVITDPSVHIDPEKDSVTYMGNPVLYEKYTYLMLNKPSGVLSATDDGAGQTVLDLLPDKYKKMGLFPCGRLDKNTVGLLILTNDGPLAHKLLAPKSHVKKTYRFVCERNITDGDIQILQDGVDIGEKKSTLPATVTLTSATSGEITIMEGKFHQIKRMFQAVCNKITYLERISFGEIPLDPSLARGEYRPLTEGEIDTLLNK